MRSELACSTSGIIVTGTETKYKQSLLQKQNTNKVCRQYKIQEFQFPKKIETKLQKENTKKIVENMNYRNSGCKTGLGGASYNVHRKMR